MKNIEKCQEKIIHNFQVLGIFLLHIAGKRNSNCLSSEGDLLVFRNEKAGHE